MKRALENPNPTAASVDSTVANTLRAPLTAHAHGTSAAPQGRVDRCGRRVEAGETIARVGATGWTGSPQLHYEIRRRAVSGGWTAVDPGIFLLALEAPAGETAEPAPGGPAAPPLPRAFQP